MTKRTWRALVLLLGLAGLAFGLLNQGGLFAQQSRKGPVFTDSVRPSGSDTIVC
jgi:hypothetical protein